MRAEFTLYMHERDSGMSEDVVGMAKPWENRLQDIIWQIKRCDMMKYNKRIKLASMFFAACYVLMEYIARHRKEDEDIDDNNPYLEDDTIQFFTDKTGMYEDRIKPFLDKILSFCGLVVLSPLYIIIGLVIYLDDPGPIIFIQKRVGKDKRFFQLHKFRTMKVSAPHDTPTHEFKNSNEYITKVGKFLRKYSMDELPQVWDIFRGKMSIIGPRPALWNQKDLIEERDQYSANCVKPGLTGLAQIKGRDELPILEKARLDGEYIKHLKLGGFSALCFDMKLFFGTIISVLYHDGVVEGGK